MDELFGAPMNWIMAVLLAITVIGVGTVAVMAWRNRIMLKLGLRNIPRRRGQTVLIIIGIMLSSLITAAAFGTGDTISFSIRNDVVDALGTIDEIIVSNRATSQDNFGTSPYFPFARFQQLKAELSGLDTVDGVAPMIGETVPGLNPATQLSEGSMNVTGVAPRFLEGFDSLTSTSGVKVRLEELAEGEVYINDKAAEELGAAAGDELQIFVGGDPLPLTVKEVVNPGALAGARWESTVLMPLDRAQRIFDREGQINSILVSNRGGEMSGADFSEEVTRKLRVLFADPSVAAQLKELLAQEGVLAALDEREESLSGNLKEDISTLREELRREEASEELTSLLSDRDVSGEVMSVLDDPDFNDIEGEASALFADLSEFRVFDIKRFVLDLADDAGSITTTIFIFMALFSILVGVLLIFLIFVMLAAARRPEMGMARAVGAKRSHLVQMFVFEGTAYALVAAAVGVLLGWGVSTAMVAILNWIIASFEVDFELTPLFKLRSAIVAYCLGMVITFATVAVSAYRVSRMNIVQAVRGLPESLVIAKEPPFLARLWGLPRAVVRPLIFLALGLMAMRQRRFARSLAHGSIAVVGVATLMAAVGMLTAEPAWLDKLLTVLGIFTLLIWGTDILVAVVRFVWPYLLRGWLTLLLGLLIALLGVLIERDSIFYIGASLMVIGLGLMFRKALKWTSLRPDLRDRVSFTAMGVLMLVLWVLPADTFEGLTGPLSGDIEMMFVSGIFMVTAAVWTVMYNADLLVREFNLLTGRMRRLRPVLVTAVAYPMASKFRTGLTLAMFALVMFTVVVMSIIVDSFGSSITSDVETVTGAWDIQGEVNFNTPIQDIRRGIEEEPELNIGDFDALGGFTRVPIEGRQIGADNQQWEGYSVWAADDDYLEASRFKLKLIADGYGPAEEQVWEALKNDASLTVVDGYVVPTKRGDQSDFTSFQLQGVHYEDERMSPVDIEVREPLTGTVVPLTVIGVLDRVHDPFELGFGMLTSKSALDQEVPFPIPIRTYQFRMADGVDVNKAAKDIEASFRENGMETEVLEDEIKTGVAGIRAFYYLLIGFMALGLIVGVAGLGVISTRAVVERRQQIGVLRAIGYRRRMIELSFLLESSFVALLGIVIGAALGTVLSNNAISDIRAEEGLDTLRFSVPWVQIVLIVIAAYLFSLLTTFLPARQASRIYPAEALRYE